MSKISLTNVTLTGETPKMLITARILKVELTLHQLSSTIHATIIRNVMTATSSEELRTY